MYHPPSKRVQFWRRFASYGATILAIIALVIVFVLLVLGYQFNGKDGKIEQGGLVQFVSQPGGANITIDGIRFGAQTNTKTTLASGSHFITMDREGYQTWSKSVSLAAGSILWLNYARLIPKELPVTKVADLPSVSSSLASDDQKWMLVTPNASQPEFDLFDISQQTPPAPTKLTLPASLYTAPAEGKTQSFQPVEWDNGNRYVLVKHVVDGSPTEWLWVDTQGVDNSKNISTTLGASFDDLHFSANNSQAFYGLSSGDVRKVDLGAGTISRPLVSNVETFQLYKDAGILFTTKVDAATKQRAVGYVLDGDATPTVLQTVTDDGTTPYRIAIGEYFGTTYVAISYGDELTVRSGSLPKTVNELQLMQSVATETSRQPIARLSIDTGGRFVLGESTDQYLVYDLELHKLTQTAYKGAASATPSQQPLGWIDGYMPWSDRGGELRLYEFDGANQHDIMPVAQGQAVTLARGGTYLYGISAPGTDGHQALERVTLVLQ